MSAPPAAAAARRAALQAARGVLALVTARFITTPLAILVNALLARRLGAGDFGSIYLASAGVGLLFLFVDFGSSAEVSARVARDRSALPRVLGAGLASRLALGALALALIPAGTRLAGYPDVVREVFLLIALRTLLLSVSATLGAAVRGLERISLHARLTVVTAALDAVVLVPVLALGGGLRAAMLSQIGSAALGVVAWWIALARLDGARPRLVLADCWTLLGGGLGFVVFDLALKLQPYVDAHFLEKLARPEAIGWFAASNRIVTSLLLPATTLNFALYPTLARLWVSDREAFAGLVRTAVRAVLLLGGLGAVGTAAFAHVAIGLIYGQGDYAPAILNLQLLSIYVPVIFLSMVLGCAILAAQRQLIWAGVQALCIPMSFALDPWLIPLAEARFGNGGLGVCASLAISELLMLTGALVLAPPGVLHRSLLVDALRAGAAAAAAAGAALLLKPWPWAAIPASIAVYVAAQAALGGLKRELLGELQKLAGDAWRRKRAQAEPSSPG